MRDGLHLCCNHTPLFAKDNGILQSEPQQKGLLILRFISKEDCIPVGCIPPACWPYLPACTVQGGVGGCLLLEGGVCSGGVVSQHALKQTPPPVNRMTDRCKNIILPQTSFSGGNKACKEDANLSWNAVPACVTCTNISDIGTANNISIALKTTALLKMFTEPITMVMVSKLKDMSFLPWQTSEV